MSPLPRLPLLATALLLTLSAAGAPARAATVLVTCAGQTGEQKETKEAAFVLRAESSVKLVYNIAGNPAQAAPEAVVRVQRKLPNGSFVTFITLMGLTAPGQTEAKSLPAGNYRLEVTTAHATFTVTAQQD